MGGPFAQAGTLIIDVIFGLYIMIVMLRFLLQWVKADFYNPICQFLIKVSNPLLLPLRRIIPGLAGLDLSAIVLIILLQLIESSLIFFISGYPMGNIVALLLYSVGMVLSTLFKLYFYAIIIQSVVSWFNQGYNPIVEILHRLTDPLLRPVRRIMPDMGGIDLSPIPVLLILLILPILVSTPMTAYALQLMAMSG
ncbi:YGGT family protein [Piscirickettsia salmonis]|uniref:YggT family protein n=1 Tax=Piscirickettsia salmonis TaxID=1238 RepID=UPI0012B9BA4A|nr:YggT family protein [Piscirickettsia salmonis]QGP48715.1 YGGT family protein [Piscirickettsia salmonis]